MTELIAAFITIHGFCTFLADVYSLLNQPGKTIWLSVNQCRLGPVDRVIFLVRVVIKADLLISAKLAVRRLLVKARLVIYCVKLYPLL